VLSNAFGILFEGKFGAALDRPLRSAFGSESCIPLRDALRSALPTAYGTAFEELSGVEIESPFNSALGSESCIPPGTGFGAAL
jgi:hypothetical protein